MNRFFSTDLVLLYSLIILQFCFKSPLLWCVGRQTLRDPCFWHQVLGTQLLYLTLRIELRREFALGSMLVVKSRWRCKWPQWGQKFLSDQKAKSWITVDLWYDYRPWKRAFIILLNLILRRYLDCWEIRGLPYSFQWWEQKVVVRGDEPPPLSIILMLLLQRQQRGIQIHQRGSRIHKNPRK